jgi:hypothetical protein
VKYLYCPKCKDLRVKSWYAFNDKCPICFSDANAIRIPNRWLTYVLYALYVLTPALIAVYLLKNQKLYLYTAVVLVVILMVISWIELGRGREYARTKVRKTADNLEHFRKRGWS